MRTPHSRGARRPDLILNWALVAALGAGCSGAISEDAMGGAPTVATPPGSDTGTAGASGQAPTTDPGTGMTPLPPANECRNRRTGSPGRIWRLSGDQYTATIKALHPSLATASFNSPLAGLDNDTRFSNEAREALLPADVVSQSLTTAETVARTLAPKLMAESACLAQPDAACLRAALAPLATRAFRRPVEGVELDRYVELARGMTGSHGAQRALTVAVEAMLSSPHFLFRWELGDGKADAAGLRRLTSHELASALSYTLADAPPDATLMQAAAQGALATKDQVRAQAQRLMGNLADSRVIARFFTEYFRFDRAPDITKDPKEVPFHKPELLVNDTERFIREVVGQRKDLLATLLTADFGIVRDATAGSYNLDRGPGAAPSRVTFRPGERFGLLTQPSFLTAFSENDHTDPVRRGKFIAQSLLCLPLPDVVPANVPPLPPAKPGETMRDRLKVHSKSVPSCWSCHEMMDPLGLGLEAFDDVGRFRTMEEGRPVDASGEIRNAGPELDGPYKDAGELMRRIAGAERVQRCFVQHGFRYWYGRGHQESDACTLAEARDAFERSGGDLGEMILALVTSDTFLFRSAP